MEDRQGNRSLQPNILSAVMEFEPRVLGQKNVGLILPRGLGPHRARGTRTVFISKAEEIRGPGRGLSCP